MVEPDIADYLRMVMALGLVIGLIAFLAWILRRWFIGGTARPGSRLGKRLSVVESATVDPRHRLVLVRRDDREHLLLIGGSTPLLVEGGIPDATNIPQTSKSTQAVGNVINPSETKNADSNH